MKLIATILASLVLLAPTVAASGQYHYTHTTTKGQTVGGQVGIYVGGVLVVSLNGDTLGSKDLYTMTSDASCVTKYNRRSYEEAFSGIVSGTNPETNVPLTWFYNSLIFIGDDAEHVSYNGNAPLTSQIIVHFGPSTYAGTTALYALGVIVTDAKLPSATIYAPEILAQMEQDVLSGSTQIEVDEIEATFFGSGAGTEKTIQDLDWGCP